MRTFIAIDFGERVRAGLADFVASVKGGLGAIGWVKQENIHMTLKFLGEIEPDIVAPISERLADLCRTAHPMSFRSAAVGCFPSPRRPRVIWAGLEGDLEALRRLQDGVESALEPLGFAREQRRFSPHITLGRVRGGVDAGRLTSLIAQSRNRSFGEGRVDEVLLMESTLHQGRSPVYSPLARFELGAGE